MSETLLASPEAKLDRKIPLCDLNAQYQAIKDEVQVAISDVLESCAFIKGPAVSQFEEAYAGLHGLSADRAVGCANGTSALTAVLKAMDLPLGSEVIIPSHTFFSTAESVLLAGYTPVFADIKPEDYTLDPAAAEALVTPRTKAIVPVHIYGGMADLTALQALADHYDLKIVEDTAQAHLATWNGRMAGTIGDAGTYSFYPGKNLGAYGDAGLVLSRHADLAGRVRKLVDHGRLSKYLHDMVGDNMRIDTIQAAVLNVKLKYLQDWTERRRNVARQYDTVFQGAGFKVIEPAADCAPVYHLYIVEVDNQEEVLQTLKDNGIAAGVHYPIPVHAQPALQDMELRRGPLDTTDRIAKRIVSLPIYPELATNDISRVCDQFLSVARTS